MYDLIVVGAGPGGSHAATVALRGGLSVVQVDKASFPRIKPCAGGMTEKSRNVLQLPIDGMVRYESSVMESNIWGVEDNTFTYSTERILSMVFRPEFDNYLVEHNRTYPQFIFWGGERVKDIQYCDDAFHVTTDKRVLMGRQLVGADGANGITNRIFRVAEIKGRAYALEVNLMKDRARVHTPLVPCIDFCAIREGYGWVFPKNDHWSVGLYTFARGLPDLKGQLLQYIHAKGFVVEGDPLATFEAHPIPVGGYRIHVPRAPFYIVGDAGGFADAILGEGIFYALESGRLAGQTAVSVAQEKKSHREYYRALRKSILPDTFLTYHIARVVYGFPEGRAWRLGKRLFQRLILQGYVEGKTFTQSLRNAFLLFPKSLLTARMEVQKR